MKTTVETLKIVGISLALIGSGANYALATQTICELIAYPWQEGQKLKVDISGFNIDQNTRKKLYDVAAQTQKIMPKGLEFPRKFTLSVNGGSRGVGSYEYLSRHICISAQCAVSKLAIDVVTHEIGHLVFDVNAEKDISTPGWQAYRQTLTDISALQKKIGELETAREYTTARELRKNLRDAEETARNFIKKFEPHFEIFAETVAMAYQTIHQSANAASSRNRRFSDDPKLEGLVEPALRLIENKLSSSDLPVEAIVSKIYAVILDEIRLATERVAVSNGEPLKMSEGFLLKIRQIGGH